MHAYLIIGKENSFFKKEIDKLSANNHIQNQFEFKLVGVEDVANLKKTIKYEFAEKTAIVIKDLDKASIEAQNALLKTLEEPPKNIFIIILVNDENIILDTIRSRMVIIEQKISKLDTQVANDFRQMKLEEQFMYISKFKGEREKAANFLESLLVLYHQEKNFEIENQILITLKRLKSNTNLSLQLTNLLVTMNRN